LTRAALATAALLASVGPATAHHVGSYTPRDNEISANFKQLKFAIQAGKFDVARRLFDDGALRREMRAQVARLPAGLEEATRAALRAGDARDAERWLMVFFAVLVRDLALEAERQVAGDGSLEARAAAGQKFLDAIWRYYNLVDFALSQRAPTASTGIRLAFDEAEGYVKGPAAPAANLRAAEGGGSAAPAPEKLRVPLRRIAQILSEVIASSSTPTRRQS
jgi:hypothetical protein